MPKKFLADRILQIKNLLFTLYILDYLLNNIKIRLLRILLMVYSLWTNCCLLKLAYTAYHLA